MSRSLRAPSLIEAMGIVTGSYQMFCAQAAGRGSPGAKTSRSYCSVTVGNSAFRSSICPSGARYPVTRGPGAVPPASGSELVLCICQGVPCDLGEGGVVAVEQVAGLTDDTDLDRLARGDRQIAVGADDEDLVAGNPDIKVGFPAQPFDDEHRAAQDAVALLRRGDMLRAHAQRHRRAGGEARGLNW